MGVVQVNKNILKLQQVLYMKDNRIIDTRLKHNSDIPLYQQLAKKLEKSINSGSYREKEKIPSENDLCTIYGVSRITVRQALDLLEQRGLIYSVHGKGTFVKFSVISQQLFKIVNFSKILQDQGLKGHTVVHAYHNDVKVDEQTEKIMETHQLGPLSRLELVGFAEGLPIVYYSSLLRKEMGISIHQNALELMQQGEPFSTYDLLHRAMVRIGKIEQTILACTAGKEIGAILNVPHEMAMIVLKTVIFNTKKVPVEYKIGYYRGDKFSFELKREM